MLAIATKWLVIGRFKPGRYPLWGVYYFRWWLVQRMLDLTHIKWFQGSPLMRVYLVALGAKVGQDANISELEIGAVDLMSIGARHDRRRPREFLQCRPSIGADMIIGTIEIGPDCYIGSSCVIEDDVVLEEGAELRDLTALAPFTRVDAWEIWDGSPGRCVGSVDKESLRPFAEVSAGQARRADLPLHHHAAGDSAGRPVAAVPGLLGVRPHRRLSRPRGGQPHRSTWPRSRSWPGRPPSSWCW